MAAPETENPSPWHAAYPAPKATPSALPRQELLQWFREGKQAGKDFVLVDVRRTDFEVCLTNQTTFPNPDYRVCGCWLAKDMV